MQDMEITCAACQQAFPFTAQEQAFYAERGFQAPKRCRRCRQARRTGKRGPRSGQGAISGRRPAVDQGARQVHTAHCAGCGQATEVPFPVSEGQRSFCKVCFEARCEDLVASED
jgi:CxxC-x17-CxxC domain-containing protein